MNHYFTGKARYYAQYRGSYPAAVFDIIISQFNLSSESVILDLGCGTGNTSLPLAIRGYTVYAVDPEPDMITEAKLRESESKPLCPVRWISGSDATLTELNLPRLKLCTMGLSFHWMDRHQTLKTLDTMIEPDGGIVCLDKTDAFQSASIHQLGRAAISEIQDMLGDSWDYFGRFEKKDRKKHEEFFAHSSFPVIKKIEFDVHEEHTIEELIGLLLSYSYIHPVLLNERNAEFRDRMTRRLLEIQPGGVFVEELNVQLLIATRPKM
ncbi:class I SAM-dependent methyltransferase [uncultured Methanospirillum sp.]|uniref:class I SAM-dependent methyltransferase n=1 Tax=uncultured Methanospirillum sp. TaxID=262503 RepID=UPI0029C69B9B|nr:class I SAM-dependent methyltransferase [uncultured Methanospirillum sp.]